MKHENYSDRVTAAISDIHGRLDLLKPPVDSLVATYGELRLVMLGDYVDRGPESAGAEAARSRLRIHLAELGYPGGRLADMAWHRDSGSWSPAALVMPKPH